MAKEGINSKDHSECIIDLNDLDDGENLHKEESQKDPIDKAYSLSYRQNEKRESQSPRVEKVNLTSRISENSNKFKEINPEIENKPKNVNKEVQQVIENSISVSDKKNDNSDSIYLGEKNLILEDPRMSVDFGGSQKHQDQYMMSSHNSQNMSIINSRYDPNMYNRRNEYYGQDMRDMNSKVYNPNMSTMRFMAEVDLRCDDHLTKLKEDVQADRYCSDCKVLCCDSCVIEFHNQHIQAAKTKIEEYFKKQKLEMEDLRSKINSSIKHKTALSELHVTMDTHEKNLTNYFLRRKMFLENLKSKIESLLSDENDLCNKMKENLEAFYRDECYRRMDKPLKEMESLLIRLQSFLRDWDTFSRTDKARALKNDQVSQFKQEANELGENIKNAVDLFKGKSKSLEKNLTEIMKIFAYNDKMSQIENILFEVSDKVKSSHSHVNKLNFEEIIVEEIQKIQIIEKNNNNERKEDFSLIPDSENKAVLENNQSVLVNKNISQNDNSVIVEKYPNQMLNNSNSINSYSNIVVPSFNYQNDQQASVPYNNNYNNVSNISNSNSNVKNEEYPKYQFGERNLQNNSLNNIPSNIASNIFNNNNIPSNIPSNISNNNILPNNSNIFNVIPNNVPSFIPNNLSNNIPINSNSNIMPLPQNVQIQEVIPIPYFIENKHNSDFIIGIKPKSDELVVYDPRQLGFVTVKLNKSYFNDQSKTFATFPDNCKYVNLGFSIMITGGYINKQVTSNCYLVVLDRKHNSKGPNDVFDVNIMSYSNMAEARERHNIINLYDRNMVLVCSGFFNSNSEVTDINSGVWRSLSKMNDVRANATIAYINKRFVYVFGGFKINEAQTGVYQNTYEVIDLNNLTGGWTFNSFDKIGVGMRLSAMGVINMDEKSVLLCGGYDGSLYKKDVFRIETNQKEISKVDSKVKNILPGNFIFLQNNFVKIDDYAYNFDLTMNIIRFDPSDNSFKVNSANQAK